MTDDELLTATEVAKLFKVDRRTVVRWARDHKIDSVRTLGGHFRFPTSAVQKLLKTRDG